MVDGVTSKKPLSYAVEELYESKIKILGDEEKSEEEVQEQEQVWNDCDMSFRQNYMIKKSLKRYVSDFFECVTFYGSRCRILLV